MRGDESPMVYAVLRGCVRVDLASDNGRQTLRYAREGDLVGVARMMLGLNTLTAESVTPSSLAILPPRRFREVMDATPSAWEALAAESARQYISAMQGVGGHGPDSARARVASHLIEMAVVDDAGNLVANATHQEVAEAVGTAREVVSRILGAFRQKGLVQTNSKQITLLEPEQLSTIVVQGKGRRRGQGAG
jgi:CRP-like cAMP-binding protein